MEILHCENQEAEYLENLIITLDDTEEEFYSWIWFGFFFHQDSEVNPELGLDYYPGYAEKLYYYIGPQGIGFSADNMDEAKINYEKIGVDPVRERIEIGKKKES